METKRDWNITFDVAPYIAMHGESFAKLLQNSARQAVFDAALAEIKQAIEPAACWDRFPIQKILHDRLLLVNGRRIGGGPVTTVLGGAEALLAAVCTIGPKPDRLIEAAQKQRDLFKGMLLHDLAAWAVDLVRQQVCLWLETEAHRQGLRVSAPLSPGESAWSVKEQGIIFSLLDTGQIGVSLSPSMVMTPIKSLSLIMGIGAQPMGVEGASNCDFCSIKERCAYRRMRVNPPLTPA
jgi:hypothetical protein